MTAHTTTAPKVIGTVPGLDVFRNGFDAKRGDFANDKVFAPFTFATKERVEYGSPSQPYLVPDDLACSPVSDESYVALDQLLQTVDDYDRTFSVNVEVEGSYGIYSAGVKSSYFQHEHLLTSRDRAYAMNFFVARTYTARRLDPILSESFRKATAALPARTTSPRAHQAYADFFRRYGTHYLAAADFGGYVLMTSSVDKNSVTRENESKIVGSITASFEGVVAKGSLSVEVANEEKRKNEVVQTEIVGNLHRVGGQLSDDKSTWEASLYGAPRPLIGLPPNAPVMVDFRALSALVPDEERARTMDEELALHLGVRPPALLGGTSRRRRDLPTGTVLPVDVDSIVVGVVSVPHGPRGTIELRSEHSGSPRKVLGAAAAHHYVGDYHDNWVRQNSTTAPVRKGDHLLVRYESNDGQPAVSLRSLQFGATGGDDVGAATPVALGKPVTTASDGLLVCALNCTKEGERGGAAATIDGVEAAACSGHWNPPSHRYIPRASFCLPVRRGETYAVTARPTWGTPVVEATFIPLVGAIGLGEREPREADAPPVFTAEDDGLLVGWSHANNGTRGDVTVYAGFDADEVRQGTAPVVAAMSAHANHSDEWWGVWIDDAFVCVPVMKGESCLAVRNDTWGKPVVRLWWVPLTTGGQAH
jgi:hypothetical protein